MLRPRFAPINRYIVAMSVVATVVVLPATTASAATCAPPAQFCLGGSIQPVPQQVIIDPGFEDVPQITQGHPGWTLNENEYRVTKPHHSGDWAMAFNTWGTPISGISQSDIFIPPYAPNPRLHFYLYISTARSNTVVADTFTVTANGTQLAQFSNLDDTHGGWCRKGDYDMSAFRGKSITLVFTGRYSYGNGTNFFLDDVELWTSRPNISIPTFC
jgi:hypothetical protein